MKAKVNYIDQPLQNMKLQGLHLIEASAGTGKTWTLSSLMVRILTEKYMPRQVIATTFTRAAAAELKSRIRLRLQEMQRQTKLWADLTPTQYQATLAALNDPLEQILFKKFQNYQQDVDGFVYLNNRLKLVIDSLDELFVGTIDSFTQKLLREFSFESGEVISRQMTEKENSYPYQIVHDVLRAWLMQQPQEVVDLLLLSQALKDTDDYVQTVTKTLNFSQAKIQEVYYPKFSLQRIQQLMQQLKDFTSKSEYLNNYQPNGVFAPYLKKADLVQLIEETFPQWQEVLKTSGIYAVFQDLKDDKKPSLTKRMKSLLKGNFSDNQANAKSYFAEQITLDAKENGVTKTAWLKDNLKKYQQDFLDDLNEPLIQHGLLPLLSEFFSTFESLEKHLSDIDAYLRYYLSIEVKKRLPEELLQAGETTFNQQTRTLSEALEGERGQQFAQAVLQHYPIILVDEFQDTNQEQDNILKTIWRNPQRLNQSCFIVVGDPKQAIYGFRGGDILTYINAFNDVAAKQGCFYRLKHNFRSVKELVNVVDELFMRQTNFGENIDYYQASSGNDKLMPLVIYGKADFQPLKLIKIEKDFNEEYIVAHKIRDVLLRGQKGQFSYLEKDQLYAIQAEDIAVLAANQRDLDLVQHQLEKLKIQVNRATLTSVFSSQNAQDIGAILQAIVQPELEAKLKRALLTPAIGLTLADFNYFDSHADAFSQHIHNFRYARQIWLSKGFLLAWQWLADHYQIWPKLAEHQADQAERSIVNTRHLIELLSQHSYQYQGIQHLLHWYQLQLSSPQQRDWELERKLSSASGVQLMTIHKSKGLEFKIVFLMGANKSIDLSKTKAGELGFFEQGDSQHPERVIAVSPKLIKGDEHAYNKHIEKKLAENRRLWYVALTRASYAIYLICKENDKARGELGAVNFWLKAQDDDFQHEGFVEDTRPWLQEDYQAEQKVHMKLNAIAYPNQYFYPKTRTSFSYLSAHKTVKRTLDALAEYSVEEEGANDEQQIQPNALTVSSHSQPLTWIQNHFPKGAKAGNCLHGLFEDLDFQHQAYWDREINYKLSTDGMWAPLLSAYQSSFNLITLDQNQLIQVKDELRQQLKAWLELIVQTPIHTVNGQDLCLRDIPKEHRLAEFDFYLSLSDQRFMSDSLHQLFVSYGYEMPEFEQANTARFLNGAIDLTYFDGQKFHIADYKSNYLGDALGYYSPEEIAQSMTASSYWLQAGIYLVALHRHLKMTFLGYEPEQHLGGASYLYLRGMQGQDGFGVHHWQAPLALILALDELLGQHLLTHVA